MPDGRLVFCDGNIGDLFIWDGDAVGTFAVTGGPPWGAVLGSGGATYVTQGGNVPGSVRRDDGVGGRVRHLPGGRARRDIGLGEHATL
jgi:hypothetical protein